MESFEPEGLKARWTLSTDYALMKPNGPVETKNLYHDVFPLQGVGYPVSSEVDQAVWVLAGRGKVKTSMIGIRSRIMVGGREVDDAVLTPLVTREGDSGCALIDRHRRVLGLLHGYTRVGSIDVSVFLRPDTILSQEQATMV